MRAEDSIDSALSAALEAEKAVLGGILIDSARFDDAAEILGADDWFREAHRILWDGYRRCTAAGTAIDLVTLRGVLTADEYARIGGPSYVASLTDGVPRSANVGHYARQVRDAAIRREVERAARAIADEARTGDADGETLLDRLEAVAQGLRLSQPSSGCAAPDDRVSAVMRALEESRGQRGIPSGLQEIDAMTFGWRQGQLIVLGARPSQGKTALAIQMAVQAGTRGPVLFCSLEMATEQISLRELAMRSGISHTILDAGHVNDANGRAVADGVQAMADGNIHIFDKGGQTVSQVKRAARRLIARTKRPMALVVVDYLQLMRAEPGTRSENRTIEVMQFSMGLKQIAKDLACPVLALSQLSRDSEKRNDKRPMLADLRDSGSIEQDADVVLLLHRPGVAERNPADTRAEVIVAKQRNGPTGIAHLRFMADVMMFRDAIGTEVYA